MKKWLRLRIGPIPKYIFVLLGIILIGIFLRTYNFHDWLRFNADQGRDFELVSRVVDGTDLLPLMGPKAGGTDFKLGPAFYYFQIVSAKFFGNYPDKLAYPDLATSILCIPLIFFFLRKYFDKKTALVLAAIFAVSAYAIYYSRFAWNPNSTPFWTILSLYAISEVISQKNNRKFLWAIVAGVAIGIAMQLHTMLLLILPMTTIIIFGYLSFRKRKTLKYFFVILALALLVNIPQFVNEYRTNGENHKVFFRAIKAKQQTQLSFLNNVLHGSSCWIQGNIDIISGYEMSDSCSFDSGISLTNWLALIAGTVFVFGGVIFGLSYLFKEKDADRKSFLALVFLFAGITYSIFVGIAFELSVRFFLMLIFLPFVLLGFWIKFLKEKFSGGHTIILIIAAIFFISSNLFFVRESFITFANYGNEGGGQGSVVILKEVEEFSQFVIAQSGGMPETYIVGDKRFISKAYKPINCLIGRAHIKLLLANKKTVLPNKYFYVANPKEKTELYADTAVKVIQYKTYGQFTILLVQNANPVSQ